MLETPDLKEHRKLKVPSPPGEGRSYFPPLTGLRTVASVMVFLHHFNPFTPKIFGGPVHRFIQEFHVGVTIFFVLSGFLICYRYYDKVRMNRSWLKPYFVNRFARIYPMYFLMTILAFLPFICHCSLRENWKLLLLNLSFARGFFDDLKFTGVKTGWSLTVEEMFYFLFPVIVIFHRRLRLGVYTVLFVSTGVLLWALFRHTNFHGFFGSLQFVFEFTFFGRCFEFFAGMYFALLFKKMKVQLPRKGWWKTAAGIFYISICIAFLAYNREHSVDADHFIFFETLINNFLLPPGIALLLYGLLSERNVITRSLGSPPFVLLGKSSYVFYLIHNGFLFSILYLGLQLSLPVVFILLEAISVVLFLLVEKPLNRSIRKLA